MRKLSKILVLVLVLAMMFAMASMFTASAASKGESWVVAGSSGLCHGENWAASSSKNKMTWDDANSRFYKEYTNVPAGTYEFKCVKNGNSWYPDGMGNNQKVTVAKDGSTVIIYISASNVISSKVIEPACANHNPQMTSTTATCLTAGKETWSCEACGEGFTSDVNAYGHHYTADGKCVRCDETAEMVRVYVDNKANWADVYCYTWDTNPYVAWPGEQMTLDSESGLYYYDVPKYFVNIIFNNGSDAKKTSDMKTPTGTATIYNNSTSQWTAPHVCNFVAGEVVAPTYTAGGYTVYSCTCGKTENRDLTDKLVPAFPEAVVTPIDGVIDEDNTLTFALNFGIKGVSIVDGELVLDPEVLTEEYIAAVLETYGKMYVDYRLTIEGLTDTEVVFNANGNADGFLGGQYDAWSPNWVCVPFDDVTIPDGGSLMIMETAAEMMGKAGLRYVLEEIVTVVIDFDCGVYFTPEFLAANPNMKVTLDLIVFNEDENGNPVDIIEVAENVFNIPYTNTVVVGENDVKIGHQAIDNGYGYLTESVLFVADEKAHYEFVGEGLTALIFDLTGKNLCGFSGKADLEAGTYIVCFAANTVGTTGDYKLTVTKSEIVVPEHVNKLVIGENNKIVISGATLNQNGNPIEWVPFVVEEKALYTFASETENALVYIFNADFSMPGGALTSAAVLEPGTYLICVGNGAVGDIYVTVTKSEVPTTCEHVYQYMNCTLCGAVNPYFEYNFMVVGTNKVICNEYHLVDITGHGNPYQFTTFTVTEAGHYKFTSDKLVGFTIFTTEVNTEGADWTAGTGASWGLYIAGNEVDLQPGTYYIGLIFVDGEGEYQITLEKVEPAHEHNFVDGECECGEKDPNYVPPVDGPVEESNMFAKIWAAILAFLSKIGEFFKGIFVK